MFLPASSSKIRLPFSSKEFKNCLFSSFVNGRNSEAAFSLGAAYKWSNSGRQCFGWRLFLRVQLKTFVLYRHCFEFFPRFTEADCFLVQTCIPAGNGLRGASLLRAFPQTLAATFSTQH